MDLASEVNVGHMGVDFELMGATAAFFIGEMFSTLFGS